jgi:hypothetical protein
MEVETMAQELTQTAWPPRQVTPGPEMQALARFFYDCTWTGKVYANMQGTGSPEMEAAGGMQRQPLMDGLWIAGDGYQDQFVDGKKLLTWKLHMVAGWDAIAREYRAVLVDSNGTATLLRGAIDGARLVMTPVGTVATAGQMGTLRLVWDATDPQAVVWRNEASVDGGPWMLIEDYVMVPAP